MIDTQADGSLSVTNTDCAKSGHVGVNQGVVSHNAQGKVIRQNVGILLSL